MAKVNRQLCVRITGASVIIMLGVLDAQAQTNTEAGYQTEQNESTGAALQHLNRNITLGGHATHIDADTEGGGNIDQWLPSADLSAAWLFSNGAYIAGKIDYTNFAPKVGSGAGRSKFHYQDIGGRVDLGWGFLVDERLLVTPHVTYTHHNGSYKFHGYKWHGNTNYIGAGLKTDYAASERLIATLDWTLGSNFSNRMDQNGIGSGFAASVKGEVDYRVLGNWHGVANVTYDHNRFGSNGLQETNNVGLGGGIRYTF